MCVAFDTRCIVYGVNIALLMFLLLPLLLFVCIEIFILDVIWPYGALSIHPAVVFFLILLRNSTFNINILCWERMKRMCSVLGILLLLLLFALEIFCFVEGYFAGCLYEYRRCDTFKAVYF